ncbi:MAG: hypothetical protein GWP19_12755 [Planctomycetia bacterium]|nr:hypothetical protein [Planctomycetia bacterium]
MIKFSILANQIKDHINEINLTSRDIGDDDKWNLLCVSMDTLEDTIEGLKYYELNGFGKDDSSKYIHLHGVLQLIFIQQNAIKGLFSIFNGKNFHKSNFPTWSEIRDLRHKVTGHPTQKDCGNKIKRIYLSRISIEDDGFDLIIWNKNTGKDDHVHIDFKSIYDEYKNEAIDILKKIHQKQLINWQ